MVAVHALGEPSLAVEVAFRNDGAGIQQENQLAVALIAEMQPKFVHFLLREDTAAVERVHHFGYTLAGSFVEKPEARHSGVIHCEIILRHAPSPLRYRAHKVSLSRDRGHTV